MKRRVRALPVMVIGVLAVVATSTGMAPAPALAGTGADNVAPARSSNAGGAVVASPRPTHPSTSRAPRGAGSILQVSSVGSATAGVPRVDVSLDPGASAQRSFQVTNRSTTLRLTVALDAVDATAQSNGDLRYASTASNEGPASWVTLSDLVETLEPGASTRVQITVAPPADALPGSVVAGVVARVDHAARVADGSAVSAQASVSLPISIKVNGAPTALVSISSVGAVKDHGDEYLDITFQNAGATANTMVGEIEVHGTGGHTYPIHAEVAPLKRTTVRLPFSMPRGAKTAAVSVSTEDGAGDQASWSGPVGFALAPAASTPAGSAAPKPRAHSSSTSILSRAPSIPRPALILVALVVALAAIWFVAELRRNRSRRRSIAIVPTMAGAFAAHAFGTPDPLGAVVSQLGALVEAIDRLVSGLASGQSPAAAAAPAAPVAAFPPAPAPTAAAVPPPPAAPPPAAPAKSPAAELAELATLISMPAAPTVPEFDESDPYDWPTQEQLDQFAERRREGQARPE